jgi:hypothetical protein
MSICAECLEVKDGNKETCILNAFKCRVVKCKKYKGSGIPAIKKQIIEADVYKKMWNKMKKRDGHFLMQSDIGGSFVLRDLMIDFERDNLK